MTGAEPPWSATGLLVSGFLTLALLFGGLGAWSVLVTISGAIVAYGQVEVSQNRQVVQHPDGGVIESILVREGTRLSAGDIVLRLDGKALRSDLAIVEAQVIELAARRARLEAQRDDAAAPVFPAALTAVASQRSDVAEMIAGQVGLFERQAVVLGQMQDLRRTRIAQIRSQIEGLEAQEAAIRAESALLEAELQSLRGLLDRGLTAAFRVSQLEREHARLKGRQAELASAQAEAASRVTETEIELAALHTQSREKAEAELREVVARQLELGERASALARRIDRLDVRAPASGIVLGLAVTTPQSVVRPAETLMVIVPQDRPLLVAARVPVTHVDEVHPGQNVRLVLSSLPTPNSPIINGTVTMISADALVDERSGLAYFRTEIAIGSDALQDLTSVAIVPGMPVDVFFTTGDRTPLSYLLKPFADYFYAAFRET